MATYAEMQEVFDDIRADFRYEHELNGCLNCGIEGQKIGLEGNFVNCFDNFG